MAKDQQTHAPRYCIVASNCAAKRIILPPRVHLPSSPSAPAQALAPVSIQAQARARGSFLLLPRPIAPDQRGCSLAVPCIAAAASARLPLVGVSSLPLGLPTSVHLLSTCPRQCEASLLAASSRRLAHAPPQVPRAPAGLPSSRPTRLGLERGPAAPRSVHLQARCLRSP